MPDLFTPSTPPPGYEPTTEQAMASSRRPRPLAIGAALVGLLLVAGLVVALLIPDDVGTGSPDGVDELIGSIVPAVDDPGTPPAPDAGARIGAGRRGLGDDTLLVGRVVANNAGSLVVAQDGGPERTVRTDGRTAVRGAGHRAVADLRPGERVLIRVDGTGDAAVAVGVGVRANRLLGTVTALSGDTATLVRIDGRTETVNVAAVDPKPAIGDLVLLGATVPPDGAGFTAERIRVLPRTR